MNYFGRYLLMSLAVVLFGNVAIAQSLGDNDDQIIPLPSIHTATRLDRAGPPGGIGVGAMPVAAERIRRKSAPRPLPMNTNRWRSVAATFDPDKPLDAYHGLDPNGFPKGNLEGRVTQAAYDDYVARVYEKELSSGPVSDYEMHRRRDPNYSGPDHAGDSPTGDLWDYYHKINHRWWVRSDLIHWRLRGYTSPTLVTQSPPGTNGVLPGAETLFPIEQFNAGYRDGGRLRIGWWAVDGQFVGYQAEYFGFGTSTNNFFASSTASGLNLARPFFNDDPGVNAEDAALLSGTTVTLGAFTYDLDGQVEISSESNMHSGGIIRRHVLWADFDKNCRIDWLIGYRYIRLDELLTITDTITLNNPSAGSMVEPGTRNRRTDRFKTKNDFHGGEIGLMGEIHRGRWSLEVVGKVAIGNTHQMVGIDGTLTQEPGGTGGFSITDGDGGLLAQPGLNEGRYTRNAFTMIPEAELNVAFQITKGLRATLGYNVLYMTRVVRPGNQIDRNLNPTRFPSGSGPNGPTTPQALFNESYFWLGGFSGGLEARW